MGLSISKVAALCGVSPHTLRAWEKRYRLPPPAREGNGYRSYSDDQVELLRQMTRLVRLGVPPRHAADFLLGTRSTLDVTEPQEVVDRLRAGEMNFEALTTWVQVSLRAAELADIADNWLLPMLKLVGEEWAANRISIEQEHVLAAAVMGQLSLLWDAAPAPRPAAPLVMAGLPSGCRHQIGIYTFATVLRRAGWPMVYLGADLPTENWVQAVTGQDAGAAIIAVPMTSDVAPAQALVTALAQARPGLVIGVGGSQQHSVDHPAAIRLGHRLVSAAEQLEALLGDAVVAST